MPLPTALRDLQSVSAQQWVDRAQRSLPQIISVVLVIGIAWQLVQLTWLLLDRSETQPAAIVPTPPPANAVRKGVDVQAIVNSHLFGVPAVEQQNAADAP